METYKRIIRRRNLSSFLFGALIFWLLLQAVQCLPCLIFRIEALYIKDPNAGIMEEMENEGISFGESIILGSGIYKEPSLHIPIGISLIGEDLGSVIIMGDPNNPLDTVVNVYSQSTIKNLIICNGGGVGIYIPPQDKPPSNITIEHNLIINNGIGIYGEAEQIKHMDIIGNTIVHNKDRGILIKIDPNRPILSCKENIIAFNGKSVGIEFAQQDSAQNKFTDLINMTNIFLEYNDIYDGLYRTWYYVNGFQRESEKILNLDNFGKGNISKDPFFVDANQGDYHLASYSHCIDQGDPNSDFSQEPDDNGGRVNLGFFGNSPQATPALDTDRDGILDYQEGPGDMDEDGFSDWNDSDTVIFPLSQEIDKIAVHLVGASADGNQKPRFEEAKAIPPKGLSIDPPGGILPFDAIQYHIVYPAESDGVEIRMILPRDKVDKSYRALIMNHHIRYMSLSLHSEWESIPFEMDPNILDDPNETAIIFRIEDGGTGDEDGTKNGVIDHMGALVIKSQPLTEWKDTRGCFISVITH